MIIFLWLCLQFIPSYFFIYFRIFFSSFLIFSLAPFLIFLLAPLFLFLLAPFLIILLHFPFFCQLLFLIILIAPFRIFLLSSCDIFLLAPFFIFLLASFRIFLLPFFPRFATSSVSLSWIWWVPSLLPSCTLLQDTKEESWNFLQSFILFQDSNKVNPRPQSCWRQYKTATCRWIHSRGKGKLLILSSWIVPWFPRYFLVFFYRSILPQRTGFLSFHLLPFF